MSEILFRGKTFKSSFSNGKWVYGFYSLVNDKHGMKPVIITGTEKGCSIPEFIDPATVGQFTGLVDRTGKKIFEGDVVEAWSQGVKAQGVVQKRIDGLWIIYPAYQKNIIWGLCPEESGETNVTVIGNIHDTKEEESE